MLLSELGRFQNARCNDKNVRYILLKTEAQPAPETKCFLSKNF